MAARQSELKMGTTTYGLRFTLHGARVLDPEGKKGAKDLLEQVREDREFLKKALWVCIEGWRVKHAPKEASPPEDFGETLIDEVGFLKAYVATADAILGFYNPEVPGDPKAPEASSTAPGAAATPAP